MLYSKISVKPQVTFTVNRHVQNIAWKTHTLSKESYGVYVKSSSSWVVHIVFTKPSNLLQWRDNEKGHRFHLIWSGSGGKLHWTSAAAPRVEWAQICTISVRMIMKSRSQVKCPFFCPWICFHLWQDDCISKFY